MLLNAAEASKIALDFLFEEWSIDQEDKDWFTVISCRPVGENWYIVEVAVEGFPDRWFIQVYDNGECDPNYTFMSPINGFKSSFDMQNIPTIVAEVLVSERNNR
jgi:hypothetical protein